ncbi:MAG: SIR2 family protein [Saprospiraceae bacterium]
MPEENSKTKGQAAGEKLPDVIYQNIARQIREGSCALFLGPAAMAAKQPNGSYRPLIELCAEHLAKGLGLSKEDAEHLAQVSSTLRMRNALSDTMIIAAVQDFYQKAEREAELQPVLEQLADLPFKLIVNTSPDDFFARFYAQAVRDYKFDYYNFRKPSPDPLYTFGDDEPPLIYNLFGFYKKPESLVLTYGDQLGYVNKITGAQHERLPDSLLAAFNVPRFYLFMGFDFEDWSLRILFDALFRNARNSIQPFAYPQKGEPEAGARAKVFFQGEFRMEFPQVDMETFVQNLLVHYRQLDGEASSDSSSSQAEVLILHNEATDDDGCKALLSHLRPLKVRTWTLADAIGEGDQTAWLRQKIDQCQVVLPLVTADFFQENNPALPLLDELVQRNNPRSRFLVMPILLKATSFDGTSLSTLRTTRPLQKKPVFGEGQEDKHLAEIAETLKKYIDTLA